MYIHYKTRVRISCYTTEILTQNTPRVTQNSGKWPYVGWVVPGVSKNCSASIIRVMWFKKRRFLDPEDESNTILRNVGKYLLNDTASRPRRQIFSNTRATTSDPPPNYVLPTLIPACCSRELLQNVTVSVTTPSVAEISNCYSGHLQRRTPEIATSTTTGLPTTALKQHYGCHRHIKSLLSNNSQ
jgi:hypothetical protein